MSDAKLDFSAPKSEPRRIQSIGVGFRVIRVLEAADGPLPLKDIASLVKMSASKTYMYLATFEREGLVRQDESTGHYGLGSAAIQLGLAAIRQVDVIRLARDEIDHLRELTECAAYISIWGNRGPVITSKADGYWQGSMGVRVGFVLPLLRSSTGKVFLAFLPSADTKDLLAEELAVLGANARFDPSLSRPDELAAAVRKAGYAVSEGQINFGFASLAVPVFDHADQLACALTILGPASLLPEEKRAVAIGHLSVAAARLCRHLGGNPRATAKGEGSHRAAG